MKLLFSLLSLGTTVGGVFVGTLQQNLSHQKTPEIDLLFEKIEKLIRGFSKKNPINKEDLKEIKCAASVEGDSKNNCKELIQEYDSESKNTLEVWTTIWVSLISNYVSEFYKGEGISKFNINKNKKEALKKAEMGYEKERQKFKEILKSVEKEIESIYEKIKKFVLKISLPLTYEYNVDNSDGPYENYIEEIKKQILI